MTNADLIMIWAVMIHGLPVKTYNALQNHIIVLLSNLLSYELVL